MKIAYITGDIMPNGNFSLFHDLLGNYPCPYAEWFHRVYLISPRFDVDLVHALKNRYIDVRACFEIFQSSTDEWWNKIRQDIADCDVIISGNITNLDEVIPDQVGMPVVSLSLAEQGYRSPQGGYGSFYKERFHKVAVSQTAVKAFPEHVRSEVEVIYSGLDPSRVSEKVERNIQRNNWFPNNPDVKILLFIGMHQGSKGFAKAVETLDHLPRNWHLISVGIINNPADLNIPAHLQSRVHICSPTFYIADLFLACDCFILPTEHEGLSMSLLEAWYLKVPVVTTKHNTVLELQGKHPQVEFGQLVELNCGPKDLAEAVQQASASKSAQECMYQNYMASHMVDRWREYLQRITGKE